ncbi:MAG: hypothetical protein ABIP97_02445 [Chthoniobacterales bacterium]
MPERLLRPGILTSERINMLSMGAEIFYRRLMSVVDDFGRFDARPSILRASLYPLQIDRVSEASLMEWRAEAVSAGLLSVYSVQGKEYLEMSNFRQRLRAAKSKYPGPTAPLREEESATHLHPEREIESFPLNVEQPPSVLPVTAPAASSPRDIKPTTLGQDNVMRQHGNALGGGDGDAGRDDKKATSSLLSFSLLAVIPDFQNEWQCFRMHRQKMRKPLTTRAEELILGKLSEYPARAIEALRTCQEKGWLSFEWDWLSRSQNAAYGNGRSNAAVSLGRRVSKPIPRTGIDPANFHAFCIEEYGEAKGGDVTVNNAPDTVIRAYLESGEKETE